MKAIQFRSFGDPSVLEYIDVPTPTADGEHAVIQVKAASVNPSDVKNVSGHFTRTTLPRIPGRDFSGVVASGPAAWVGTEVWGTGGDIGSICDGAHAQFIQVPIGALVRKPSTLSHEEASAIGVTFVTAWLGLVDAAVVRAGETVAVMGAGGGVGGAVVQIAKSFGCRVIGVDRSQPAAGSPAARLLDAFVPLGDDTSARVRDVTRGGADVVFDTVGGVVFETSLSLARRRGRVVVISAVGKRRVEFDLVGFYHNETRLLGVDSVKLDVAAASRLLAPLGDRFENGALEPPLIADRFGLARAREGYEAVAKGKPGRVVLTM